MITADGKCDGKCSTCNIVQQSYCKLVQFRTEQDKAIFARLEHLEEALREVTKKFSSEIIIAQGGDGAEKVANV